MQRAKIYKKVAKYEKKYYTTSNYIYTCDDREEYKSLFLQERKTFGASFL